MPAPPLSRSERDELVRRALAGDARRFPDPEGPDIDEEEFNAASEEFYLAVGEYFDRLPRVTMSACPWCGSALWRAFDSWGVDGPWWGIHAICKYDEPEPCEHFRVLLGALQLPDEALPARLVMESRPGPAVPFVVPRLLALPGMIAVVGRLPMACGGQAFPIAYFSERPVEPDDLHQEWRRTMLWFQRGGGAVWTTKHDRWDAALTGYLSAKQLRWVVLDEGEEPPRVRSEGEGAPCPFVDLAGERRPQIFWSGGRDTLDPPDGSVLDPFEEDGGA